MTQTSRARLRDVVVNTGLWPRRQLRRIRRGVETPEGERPLDAFIALDDAWTPLKFQRTALRARLVHAPVFVLHKPLGCVTSRRREAGAPTVFEHLDDALAHACEPVGRLDLDTSGVLLFAADGQLLHRLTHPKYDVVRTYEVTLAAPVAPDAAERLRAGEVTLDDGHVPRPTRLEVRDDGRVELDLREGKYHEVRRMFAAVGSPVVALHRTHYAGVTLDGLAPGDARRLDGPAIEALCGLVSYSPAKDFLEVEVLDG